MGESSKNYFKMKPEKLGSISMAENPEKDIEVETITLSDEEEPPPKVMKTIDPPKQTARKKMSSFTPKLHPIDVVTLDKPEIASGHPDFNEVNGGVTLFMAAIKSEVNGVEHAKIKDKFEKRLSWVRNAPHTVKLTGLTCKIKALVEKASTHPEIIFEVIKELLDEFGRYKNVQNGEQQKEEVSNQDAYDAQKNLSHIKKLEKALHKCGKAIKKLEMKEMSLDELDDEDSNYIKIDRYKKRFMVLTRKVAQMRQMRPSLGRFCDKKFVTQASRIPEVNTSIMELVNRQRKFPDFPDIFGIYKEVNKTRNTKESESTLENYARETFSAVGQALKKRRVHDDMNVIEAYLPEDHDDDNLPEFKSNELKSKLDENVKTAEERMNNLYDQFAKREAELNAKSTELEKDEKANDTKEDNDRSGDDDTSDKEDEEQSPESDNDSERNEEEVQSLESADESDEEQQCLESDDIRRRQGRRCG